MHVEKSLFSIVVAITLVLFLFIAVEASRGGNCVCYFVGACQNASDGTPVRYYQCTGSCYAYSGYEYYSRCWDLRTLPQAYP